MKQILKKFINMEAAGGIIMLSCAILAMLAANFLPAVYESMVQAGFVPVNDGLMVIFFFVVALEFKRKIKTGVLSKKGQVALPFFATIGGMVVPAIIYCVLNRHFAEALGGWAIPSATDIAFALCLLLIAGKHMPRSARVFLLAIAIFDDLGAIVIIGFFYSHGINPEYLGLAIIIIMAMFFLNYRNVNNIWLYIIPGICLTWLLHNAGIHTTIAGVITGLAIPFKQAEKAENIFHPVSMYIVLPLFAFINAGLAFSGISVSMFYDTVTLGIIAGLFFGKQIGIFFTVYIMGKLKILNRPEDMKWLDIYIISAISGIGFTMSLFIGNLAFTSTLLQQEVKLGVVAGSLLSAVLAIALLYRRKKIA